MKANYKTHLNYNNDKVLCGLSIVQKGTYSTGKLPLGTPWTTTCQNCLTLYYLQNPLNPVRTKVCHA